MYNLKKDIILRTIKIVDISYIVVLYFIVGYLLGYNLDIIFLQIFGNDYKSKSKNVLILEVLLQIMIIGILSYIGRNIVLLIPFPLDGFYGFDHTLVREVRTGSFLTVFLLMFQFHLQDKINYIRKDLFDS